METRRQQKASLSTAAFFAMAANPIKLKLYLLKNLPAAYFSGLKVVQANPQECIVSVPYTWFTKNPFRSTYFACLSMGAELSTGILAMAAIYGQKQSVSMLVTGMESQFYKKAKGTVLFHCPDGEKIASAIEAAIGTGTGQEVKIQSKGKNDTGELIAEFLFTWSFKVKGTR
ncbi:MAG: DUF4442 domain-containing protein [Bacteroidota bacterium]|nr:DUF4442 domain-containing protein [Bacteroidota bacterium]